MGISIDEQIRIIIKRKDEINSATNNISEAIRSVKVALTPKAFLVIKKEIHNIVNNLNIIGSFCDKDTRIYLMNLSNVALAFTTPMNQLSLPDKAHLEAWCTLVNSISPDFNHIPFTIAREFRLKLKGIEAKLRGLYDENL